LEKECIFENKIQDFMQIPEDLKYTQDHEWIKVEGDVGIIGVTDFAQNELGDVVYLEIETEGEELSKGEVFGTIEAVKTVSDLFMPLSGKVLEVNPDLESEPELINQDPYGKGWMVKVSLDNQEEIDELLPADDYKELISA